MREDPKNIYLDTVGDKLLDCAQVGTTKLFNGIWWSVAVRHRLEEVLYVSLEHAQTWMDEVYALSHTRAHSPLPGGRTSRAFQIMSGFYDDEEDDDDGDLASVTPIGRQ